LENLKNQIAKNEESLKKMYNKYSETLNTFNEFEGILKEIEVLDSEFKKLLI
jgi:outer membrane protein assembly factor BamD (BamD/ComL family)